MAPQDSYILVRVSDENSSITKFQPKQIQAFVE